MDTMNLLKKSYMDAGISPEVYDYCHGISSRMKDRFAQIDQVAELNQIKVLRAMQKNRVSAACFESSTGYGYDDLGRETLEAVYADCFSGRICIGTSAAYLWNTCAYGGIVGNASSGR